MNRLFPIALVAGLVAALGGCASISPAGLIAASRLDPLNTPPDRIGIAVGVPAKLRLASGDAVLRIRFAGGTAASTQIIEEEAPLQLVAGPPAGVTANDPAETVYRAGLTPGDAARLAAAQAAIRMARQQGVDGAGTLAVELRGGCYVEAVPDSLEVSSWLSTDPADGYVALTRRVDAFKALPAGVAARLRARLHPC